MLSTVSFHLFSFSDWLKKFHEFSFYDRQNMKCEGFIELAQALAEAARFDDMMVI